MNRMMKAAVTRSPHVLSSVIARMARDRGVDISSSTVRCRLLKVSNSLLDDHQGNPCSPRSKDV